MRRKLEGKEARQELLGYPGRSWEPLFDELQSRIEDGGGRVLIDRPAARIAQRPDGFDVTAGAPGSFRRGHDPQAFEPAGTETYDAVVATVPNDVFARMLDLPLPEAYLERMRSIEYHTALCLLLELDRRFSPYYWTNIADPELPFVGLVEHTNFIEPERYDGRRFLYIANYLAPGDPLLELDRRFSPYYWTNIADPELPFVGLVEHTNFIEPERYDGRRFLYIANYLAPGDPLLELDADQLLDRYTPGLHRVNSAFDRSWVKQRWLHREPAAQPIVTVGYPERIPPLQTGVPHLILANTTQIYPEDRGTNYAVRLGGEAAEALLSRRLNNVWSETGS
jgi:protoporphyrinogen oxidase